MNAPDNMIASVEMTIGSWIRLIELLDSVQGSPLMDSAEAHELKTRIESQIEE